jgi:hypothetical protein
VSETKELKTCYEAKKRSCSTCFTTSQVYDTLSFGKCVQGAAFSWDVFYSSIRLGTLGCTPVGVVRP